MEEAVKAIIDTEISFSWDIKNKHIYSRTDKIKT